MAYDHNEKAGNQGDVIKHVALLAAIDTILSSGSYKSFRYCDTFAGYASSQMIQGNEWKDGIGRFYSGTNPTKGMVINEQLSGNLHVKLYRDLYLAGRTNYVGKTYPGSSLIVHALCIRHGVCPRFSLWDISPAAVSSLMTTYKGLSHAIFTRPAAHDDSKIKNADFVFIDPPKAPFERKSNGLFWADMIKFLMPQHKNFMFWLPIDFRKKDDIMIENTKSQRDDAISKGLDVVQVRWEPNLNHIKTVGCQLFYRLEGIATASVEASLNRICEILSWDIFVERLGSSEAGSDGND